MAGRLVVLDRAGRAKSKSFLLPSGMCTLGRGAACDIRVLLPTVSPHHATVTVHANQTVVRSVGSGRTLVNGEPVSVCALRHGDELALGGRRLRWEYDAPAQPRRSKTEPALALPAGAGRAARRGTLATAPRAPDRHVQLALELRHRASMPASSSAGGKQVAIVQPQRRDTTNQNDSSPPPEPAPAPRKSNSARLHTPTKATLWIESRRGRARAASLRTATPLRLAVLRKALTPAPAPRPAVTKIRAPLTVDQTKQAAIMLMTGHTPKSKLSPGLGARRSPAFVAKRRGLAARPPRGPPAAPAGSAAPHTPDHEPHSTITPENIVPETPDKSTRKSNASGRSVSLLEIGESGGPRKSALKTTAGARKTESIKFDLSNLDTRGSVATGHEDEALAGTDDATPSSPAARRSIHSRGGRMLESLGAPLRSPASWPDAGASPASPRSVKSARGSGIVRRALEGMDGTFAREAYSVVDLVSPPACSTPRPSTSRPARGRERRDDEESPESSRRTPGETPANRDSVRLDESVPSESEDDSPKKSRISVLSTSNLSDFSFVSVESGRTPARGSRGRLARAVPAASPDTSRRSRVTLSTSNRRASGKTPSPTKRASRGRLDVPVPESPNYVSPDKSGRSRSGAAVRSLPVELSQSDISLDFSSISQAAARSTKSPKNASPDKSRKSRAANLSTTNRSTRSLPIELSQSDVSLDSSVISQATARSTQSLKSPKSVSPNKSRKSKATLSTTRKTRSLPYESPRSEGSPNRWRKSRATLPASNSSTLPIESSQSDVSLDSSNKSLGKTVSPKRGSQRRFDDGAPESPKVYVSPDKSRRSRATLSTSNRRTRSLPFESPRSEILLDSTRKSKDASKSPKDVSPDKSRQSRATLSSTGRSTRILVLESSQSDVSLDSSKKSLGKTLSPKRSSRGRVDEGASVASPDTSRKSRASLSTSNRRTRGLSPARVSRPRPSRRSARSPSASISNTPRASPKNLSSKSSRVSRTTLTLDTSARSPRGVAAAGDVTPERGAGPEQAGTPVLSIRTLLDASLRPAHAPSPPRTRGNRKTFAGARAARPARGAIRSRSLIVAARDGDVTPTGGSEPSPEAVKHKHSSAKKSRSRRSIIDTLDDSGLVRHLFGSPVKRKLSRSMTEFSRRLEEAEEPERDPRGGRRPPGAPRARRSVKNDLTDVRGVKRAFARSPADDLRRVSGVRELFREDPRDDLTDVRGVRDLFRRRGPRDELVDVRGVRRSRAPPSPDMSGVARLFDEAAVDGPGGRPRIRATYSETFVARSIRKPGKRRRTTSLSVPVDVLVDRSEDWPRAELQKRANKSVARALRQLATDTVAGSAPLPESRGRGASLRRSAAETYAAHTLPLKKRSLAAPAPRSAKKRSLPLKKRALVHSTPVKGRAAAADETLARMSPIAVEPAVLEDPVPESPPVVPVSPKEKPATGKRKTEDAAEKNESVRPSPKKTRARRAQEAAEGRRATRGARAASNARTRTLKKSVAAEAPTPKKSSAPKKAPATRRAPASPAKSPGVVAAGKRARGGARAAPAPPPARAARAAGDRSAPDSPNTSPAPGGKRAKRDDAAGDAPQPAKTRRARARASPAPQRKTRRAPPTPVSEKRGRKAPSTPESKKRPTALPNREPKRARKTPPTPEPRRGGREAPPPAEPKRGRGAPPTSEPTKGRRAAPRPGRGREAPQTPEPTVARATPEPRRGRNARREPKNASNTAPAPEARRGRRAAPPASEPPRARKAPTVVAKKVRKTPEPKKVRKTPEPKKVRKTPEPKKVRKTPEPKKSRKAPPAPEPKRGRTAPATPQRARPGAARARAKAEDAAPKAAAKPKGKKVATPVVEPSTTRGRKRKNDTASVEKKSEPSPKKPRATRAAAPMAAAPARGRRR